jgi:hypothetical protein
MPTKQPSLSWTTRARKRWNGILAWVRGEGQYAVLSACARDMTARLYPTLPAAREGLAELDRTFCGGGCRGKQGNHWIEDLGKRQRNWSY